MKHIATFVLLTLATVSVNAAQINWKIGGAGNRFYDAKGNELASVNTYLLLKDDYTGWESKLSTPSSASNVDTVLSSLSLDGEARAYVDLNTSGEFVTSSPKLTAGTRYDFYLIVVDPSTGNYLDLGFKNDGAYNAGDTATTITWTAAQSVFKTNPSKSQYVADSWTSVPEPSTAALALAGLALLLKRRRA